MRDATFFEKIALLAIVGIAIVAMMVVAIMVLHVGQVEATAGTIIGVIIGHLGSSVKDIVAAIRGYSMSAQLGKVTDQLAAAPKPVGDVPTGKPGDPVSVTEEAKA